MADIVAMVDEEPDWTESVDMSYSMQSVVERNPYMIEQRRSLLEDPVRSIGVVFSGADNRTQRIRNRLLAAGAQLLLIPVFVEPIIPAEVVEGQQELVPANDVTYFWNLRNLCEWVMFFDWVTGRSEKYPLTSLLPASGVGYSLILGEFISSGWGGSTIVYPGFPGIVSALSAKYSTDLLSKVGAEFMEETIWDTEAVPDSYSRPSKTCPGRTQVGSTSPSASSSLSLSPSSSRSGTWTPSPSPTEGPGM